MRSDTYTKAYILEWEGEVAGYALLAKSFFWEARGLIFWVEELYILPRFRSKGLGKSFFDFLDNNSNFKPWQIRLEVTRENSRAISLYKELGFKILDYIQTYKEYR